MKKRFLMVFAVGIIGFGCAMHVKPSSDQSKSGSKAEPSLSRGKELGRAFIGEALRQYQFVTDPEITSLVNRIGRNIVTAQGRDPMSFHFFVVKEPSMNAFAIPGGYIFIFDSLISKFRDPGELAGVLGHEIAHVERNHFFKDEKKILAVNLATIAAILLSRGDPATVATAQAANIDLRLHYSRENESEADSYAILYLRKAGYNPKGLVGSFGTMAFYDQFSSFDTPVYFSTHPGLHERKSQLELLLSQDQTIYPPIDDSVDWLRIQAGLRAPYVPLEDIPAMIRDLAGSENQERQHYLTGVAYLKTGHYGKAAPEFIEAIASNPGPAEYHADLAFCYFHLQKSDLAKTRVLEALERDPDQVTALTLLGRLQEREGKKEAAIETYEKALRIRAEDSKLHLYIAQSYGEESTQALKAYHLGRFLRLDLKPKEALREFKRAKSLAGDEEVLIRKVEKEIFEIRRDGI